jgi:5-methylcytosine-specific restriction endonuclease McrA
MAYFGGDGRPAIPAEIRRRVLVEAGHRCAIPTCRHIEVDIHHIIPWAQCQAHEYENLIALCPNDHRRADRNEIDRQALRLYKFNLRFAHDKFSQLEMDVLFELAKSPRGEGIQWPPFNLLLIKRLIDAGYIAVRKYTWSVQIGGMEAAPCVLIAEDAGLAFLQRLGTHEI